MLRDTRSELLLAQREQALEQAIREITSYWKGPDVCVASGNSIVIENNVHYVHSISFRKGELPPQAPVNIVPVQLSLEHFHPIVRDFLLTPDEAEAIFAISMRSRLMQRGIRLAPGGFGVGLDAPDVYARWTRMLMGQTVVMPVAMDVLTPRKFALTPGMGLFRFHSPFSTTLAEGELLRDLVNNREIVINGQEGRDWGFIVEGGRESSIWLALDPQKRYVWPESDIPEVLSADGPGYRADIDTQLISLESVYPRGFQDPVFWIGETIAKFGLRDGLNGVISPWAGGDGELGIHEESRLADGSSKAPWNIRVEVISSLTQGVMPTRISIGIAQDQSL